MLCTATVICDNKLDDQRVAIDKQTIHTVVSISIYWMDVTNQSNALWYPLVVFSLYNNLDDTIDIDSNLEFQQSIVVIKWRHVEVTIRQLVKASCVGTKAKTLLESEATT